MALVDSRETPHEAGPLKGILQGIPDLMWPENKNPFGPNGTYYENKVSIAENMHPYSTSALAYDKEEML